METVSTEGSERVAEMNHVKDYDEGVDVFVIPSKAYWDTAIARLLEILHVEHWKEGVKRLHVRNLSAAPPSFYLVYCKDEYLPDPQIARYAA